MARVLVVGESAHATGLGRVADRICRALAPRHEVHHLATDHRGEPRGGAWRVHPNPRGRDGAGAESLARLLDALRPDVVVLYASLEVHGRLERALARRGAARLAWYAPLEGPLCVPGWAGALAQADAVATFSEDAARIVTNAWDALQKAGTPARAPPLRVIEHGVDADAFRRVAPRGEARAAVLPDVPEDAFVILNANRNRPRKRVRTTLEAFARLDAPDARLVLHMERAAEGLDVREEARRLGVEDRVRLTASGDGHPAWPDERLNLLYNACDVGLNTAAGEGWGLVSFEHAATGAAQVVPDLPTLRGLWSGAARLVPARRETRSPFASSVLLDAEPEDVAAALRALHDDPDLLAEMGRRAERRARDPARAWTAFEARWRALVDDLA